MRADRCRFANQRGRLIQLVIFFAEGVVLLILGSREASSFVPRRIVHILTKLFICYPGKKNKKKREREGPNPPKNGIKNVIFGKKRAEIK